MKVIVIGGAGFIGSHVVDKLLSYGHSVRVFDRQPERFRGALAGVDYRLGDFGDKMALVEALSGMDAVYHFVSTTVPGTADLDPKTDVQDNLIGCIKLLESMQYLRNPQDFIFVVGRDSLWNTGEGSYSRDSSVAPDKLLRNRQSDDRALFGIISKNPRFLSSCRASFESIRPKASSFGCPRRDFDVPPQHFSRTADRDLGGRECYPRLPRG